MSTEKTSWIRHIFTFILIFGAGGFMMYRGGCDNTRQAGPPKGSRIVNVAIDKWQIKAEVADTPELQRKGLSGRQELAPGHGMLFVYDKPTQPDFWMRNTSVALSVAFIRSDGTVIDIQQMEPESLRRHSPDKPIKYALEVRQGYFEDRDLQPPFEIELPEEIPPEASRSDEKDTSSDE